MARQQADELLPHHPGGAEDSNFDVLLRRSIHCAHDASITPIAKTRVKKKPADRLLGQRVRIVRLSPYVRSWLLHLQRTHIHHRPAESLDPLSADGLVRREHSAECRRFDCAASRGFACRLPARTAVRALPQQRMPRFESSVSCCELNLLQGDLRLTFV